MAAARICSQGLGLRLSETAVLPMTVKFSTATLWVFAAFGALASLVTVANFFTVNSAQLKVTLYPNSYAQPLAVQGFYALKDDHNGLAYTEAMRTMFCDRTNPYGVSTSEKRQKDHFCDHAKTADVINRMVSDVSQSDIVMLKYHIENTGNKIAQGLRLSGLGIKHIDIYNSSKSFVANEFDNNKRYMLPDINPGEGLEVYVWSSLPTYDYANFSKYDSVPRVSYSGGSVAVYRRIHAPSFYYDFYDFFNTLPWVMWIFFVFAIYFVISLPAVFLISWMIDRERKNKEKLSLLSADTKEGQIT